MMDQSSSANKKEKSLSLVSDRTRDKMVPSDWEFPDRLQSVMSSESLDSSSALEVFKFYCNYK